VETVSDLLGQLSSPSAFVRLKAARGLQGRVGLEHRVALVKAERVEADSYVKRVLREMLDEMGYAPPQILAAETGDDLPLAEARSLGEIDATRQFIHEISPISGLISLAASVEIPDFTSSQTRARLERLNLYIKALRELSEADQNVADDECDLASCLQDEALTVQSQLGFRISTVGPAPFWVFGRPALISLAVSNAMRNAVEAERPLKGDDPDGDRWDQSTVVVSWGESVPDVWISVMDQGVGLSPGVSRVFDKATTLKPHHSGMGLAIAARAARSMNASLSLSPNQHGGATFVMRWRAARERVR
jgi:signal transduction histidine kinase